MSVGSLSSRSRSRSRSPSHSRTHPAQSESSDDAPTATVTSPPPRFNVHSVDSEPCDKYPAPVVAAPGPLAGERAVCRWEECIEQFLSLEALVEHIHTAHIGAHKSSYSCLWSACPRKGIAQTSRFALISHLRSHTGEKPFVCALPECDKSFTRSDALVKHMRQQHNISPPPPGRGGRPSNRKRKRDAADAGEDLQEAEDVQRAPESEPLDHRVSQEDDDDDELPPEIVALTDPQTGLIRGRPPSMVKYLIMKAKWKWAQGEHQLLLTEYERVKREHDALIKKKDEMLDQALRATFGADMLSIEDPC